MPQHQPEHRPGDAPSRGHDRRRALLIVDVQPTFCEGGELPVDGGNAVAERIARYVAANGNDYALLVTTQDWHVDPGPHFADVPDFVDSWPPHGLAGTDNAELHPSLAAELAHRESVVRVKKGEHQAAYSGFEGVDHEGRTLAQVLADAEIDDVTVCGIAESHCVKSTTIDAVTAGYPTTVLSDLTVPVTEELGVRAREAMRLAGATLRTSAR